jgi:hypothetical protein
MLSGAATNFTSSVLRAGNSATLGALPIAAPNSPVGGLQAFGMPVNTPLNILQVAPVVQIGRLDLDPEYFKGASRLVAGGFEVHDTTADLYKQGGLTVWRMVQNYQADSEAVWQVSGPGPYDVRFTAHEIGFPPYTPALAYGIPGARQWDTEEGVYVNLAFQGPNNPPLYVSPRSAVILSSYLETEGSNLAVVNLPVPTPPLGGTTIASVRSLRVHPIHMSGVWFTGLNPNTTLFISAHYYIEQFPDFTNASLVQLARPCCHFDPNALQILSEICQVLPVGVPVSENGFGDWFLDIAQKAASALGPLLTAIPHPLAKAGGALLTAGAAGMEGFRNPKYSPKDPWEGPAVRREQKPWDQEGGNSDVAEAYQIGRKAGKAKQKKKDKKTLVKKKAQKQKKSGGK